MNVSSITGLAGAQLLLNHAVRQLARRQLGQPSNRRKFGLNINVLLVVAYGMFLVETNFLPIFMSNFE